MSVVPVVNYIEMTAPYITLYYITVKKLAIRIQFATLSALLLER